MQQISDADKQVAAVILAVGLLYVFVKVVYEYYAREQFTLFNIFHPVKKITAQERNFIAGFLLPYQNFDPAQRRLFLKRFAWFKSKKHFVFYGDTRNQEQIKSYVAASAILLTMGWRKFQFERSISRIIIYPDSYYSKIGRNHHIGEYNPRLRTLVFSADDLEKGFRIPNDNLNLGIHEVAHAILFEIRKSSAPDAKRFKAGLIRVRKLLEDSNFQEKLMTTKYFREYGKTNIIEFIAVATESFVESPEVFQVEFPKLYALLRGMYNFDFGSSREGIKR